MASQPPSESAANKQIPSVNTLLTGNLSVEPKSQNWKSHMLPPPTSSPTIFSPWPQPRSSAISTPNPHVPPRPQPRISPLSTPNPHVPPRPQPTISPLSIPNPTYASPGPRSNSSALSTPNSTYISHGPQSRPPASVTPFPVTYHKWSEQRKTLLLRIMYANGNPFESGKQGVWWNMVNRQYNLSQKTDITGNHNGTVKKWLKDRREYLELDPSAKDREKSPYEWALDLWQERLNDYEARKARVKEIQGQADKEAQGSSNSKENLKRGRSSEQEDADGPVNPQSEEDTLEVVTPSKRRKVSPREGAALAPNRLVDSLEKMDAKGRDDDRLVRIERTLLEMKVAMDKHNAEVLENLRRIIDFIGPRNQNLTLAGVGGVNWKGSFRYK